MNDFTIEQALKLDPDTRTEEEINISRARIDGCNEAIKLVIRKIDEIQHRNQSMGYPLSDEFQKLKDSLGVMAYGNWPKYE